MAALAMFAYFLFGLVAGYFAHAAFHEPREPQPRDARGRFTKR